MLTLVGVLPADSWVTALWEVGTAEGQGGLVGVGQSTPGHHVWGQEITSGFRVLGQSGAD